MSYLNTHRSGSVRSVIFRENNEWFGVALEFNIVETGDTPQEVMMLLDNAIKGYVEASRKAKLSVSVLNQKVDPSYEKLWKLGSSSHKQGKKQVYSTSTQSLQTLATV